MKKFVLTPFKQWQEVEKLQHLDKLDRELLVIIKKTDIDSAEKLQLYKEILEPLISLQVGAGLTASPDLTTSTITTETELEPFLDFSENSCEKSHSSENIGEKLHIQPGLSENLIQPNSATEPPILTPQPIQFPESDFVNTEVSISPPHPSKIPKLSIPDTDFLPPPPGISTNNWRKNWISFKTLKCRQN
jgi:hypothetical protein